MFHSAGVKVVISHGEILSQAERYSSDRKIAKFDPHKIKTSEPIITKFVIIDYVSEATLRAKFGANLLTGAYCANE